MSATYAWERRLGAVPVDDGRTEFRVWAPDAGQVALRVGGADHPMTDAGFSVYEVRVEAGHGDRYEFVLDGTALPDPASRHQPDGLRGPSAVVDPRRLARHDRDALEHLVIYELHVGTFTREGTFDAAIAHLDELRDLGVTAIEVMPVAEFPGRFGWGYDGVYISAAQSSYGGPDGFARLIAAAHERGLAVILDVVYNHVGASGNQALAAYGPYFTEKYETFWGKAINYDDEHCDPVREWVLQSAEGWIRDFGVDGLRLDAIHAIYDNSAQPLVRAISERVHAAGGITIAESGLNDPKVIRPAEQGGWGCDAQWADDFHHCLRVLLTGDKSGWYGEFGEVRQLAKCFHVPFLHTGEYSTFRKKRFGAPAGDRPAEQFVVFAMNHDQVGNRALGDRLPPETRRLAAFTYLLSPFTPMLWQGEEYGENAPFQFFADHIDEEIATATREGRRREFAAFAEFAGEEVPDPGDPATFERSKLTRERDHDLLALYRTLLRRRAELSGPVETHFSESHQALLVERGEHLLACNFSREERRVPARGRGQVLLATHDARLDGDRVILPPLSGALLL